MKIRNITTLLAITMMTSCIDGTTTKTTTKDSKSTETTKVSDCKDGEHEDGCTCAVSDVDLFVKISIFQDGTNKESRETAYTIDSLISNMVNKDKDLKEELNKGKITINIFDTATKIGQNIAAEYSAKSPSIYISRSINGQNTHNDITQQTLTEGIETPTLFKAKLKAQIKKMLREK